MTLRARRVLQRSWKGHTLLETILLCVKLPQIQRNRVVPGLGPSSRPQSPITLSPADSENESSSTGGNELTQQLKKLGKYLEKKQTQSSRAGDSSDNPIDPQIDEHLVNIRRALRKSPKK